MKTILLLSLLSISPLFANQVYIQPYLIETTSSTLIPDTLAEILFAKDIVTIKGGRQFLKDDKMETLVITDASNVKSHIGVELDITPSFSKDSVTFSWATRLTKASDTKNNADRVIQISRPEDNLKYDVVKVVNLDTDNSDENKYFLAFVIGEAEQGAAANP